MIIVPTERGFLLGATATLLEEGDNLRAWAEKHVRTDPDLRWIVGNYVEADRANSNGHTFPLEELVNDQHTLAGKPLNMMHRSHYIVGYFPGAQLLTSEGVALEAADLPHFRAAEPEADMPRVEAVAGMWSNLFPEEFFNIRRAHKEGTLFFSMEASPADVSCPTCAHAAPFAGLSSDSYCEHMQGPTGPKVLHNSVFNGGAIIIPPVEPGWKRADVKTISKLIRDSAEQAEAVYASVAEESPELGPKEWEQTMAALMLQAKEFTPFKRKDLAKEGKARPDGSFPIETVADLKNAIRAVGRAKNPGAARAHIKKMAKKLGREDLIPKGW